MPSSWFASAMRRLALIALVFTVAPAAAQSIRGILAPPMLRLPAGESLAVISRMDVRVTVSGLESETVTTLTFSNPNGRPLAGDLEFPLPDGAAVAGYALDVAGRMVDGVSVTKQKARVVLETEMRRRVDPGLVEHVRGNVFRTRIFPIPARGERTVRIVSVAPLVVSDGDAACHVPLPRVAIPELALRIEIVNGAVRPEIGGFGNLKLTEWDGRWTAEAKLAATTPGDDLYVRLPKLPPLVTAVEELDGERYVSISHAPSLRALGATGEDARVTRAAVAWDASGSRSVEALRRDRALLAALLATPEWRDATIDLVVFRDKPQPARAFSVRGGDASDLLAFLEKAPCDGGTDLSALDLRKTAAPNAADAAWLLFTDGFQTMGSGPPRFGGLPVHVVTSDVVRDAAMQRFLAAATGGIVVDLALSEPAAAAALLARPPATLLRVDAAPGTLADVQYRLVPGSGRASVHARLLRDGEVTLVYGGGGRETLRVPVSLPGGAVPSGRILARAWAGRMVEELAVFPEAGEAKMAELGRRFGLVTPVTSLLVLENVQQYLEHDIEPPATWPEMREQYSVAMQARKGAERAQRVAKIDRVLAEWRERVAWWEQDFSHAKDFKWAEPPEPPARAAATEEGVEAMEVSEQPAATADFRRFESMAMVRGEEGAVEEGAVEGGVVGGVVGGVIGGVVGGLTRSLDVVSVAAQPEETLAAIAVRPWSPDTPYLEAIRAARRAGVDAAYMLQRATYAESPAFFLDCAGAIIPENKALGLRVLSNLAEMKLDDAALLRVFAWRLREAGELDRAIEVLERVLGLRPEDPQSHRDLALALGDRMERDRSGDDGVRAARLLNDVVAGEWPRFEGIEVIALMELNRLLANLAAVDRAQLSKVDFVDERLRQLLDLDVRIVMSWDADDTDIDLHVIEPSGEEAFYGHQRTTIGGLVSRDFTEGYGPEEYVLRHAMPGVYKVRCKYYGSRQQSIVGPATVTATVITNFGRRDEKRQALTLRLDKVQSMVDVGEVKIGPEASRAEPARRVTRAMIQELHQGQTRKAVEKQLGAPLRVESSGVPLLVYSTAEGTEVRLAFGPGLLWAKEIHEGAERELALR